MKSVLLRLIRESLSGDNGALSLGPRTVSLSLTVNCWLLLKVVPFANSSEAVRSMMGKGYSCSYLLLFLLMMLLLADCLRVWVRLAWSSSRSFREEVLFCLPSARIFLSGCDPSGMS